MNKGIVETLVVLMLLDSGAALWGAESDDFQFFQEEAKVITASRREQNMSEVPLAVDVVTPEEIKASGAVNIWDLLRFRVGMDVLDGRSVEGNRAIVSVRGFPQEFAQNVLVLVDDRSVYLAPNGGVYWDQLPVQMQDIDRIEIIRGPSAALYGSGAALGVINILTKKPSGRSEAALDERGGNLGMVQSAESAETSLGNVSVRLSHTFRQQNGYPMAADGREGSDFLHKHVADLRANWAPNEKEKLEMFAGGSWTDSGVLNITPANQRLDFDNHFQMLKFSHRFSPDSTLEASGARIDSVSEKSPGDIGQIFHLRALQYDADIEHHLQWWDQHMNTTYGVSYRDARAESAEFFGGDHLPNVEFYRGYFHQTVKPAEKLSLLGAVALESNNTSGLKSSYQTAVTVFPVPEHALRASYSVSYTARDLGSIFYDYHPDSTKVLLGNPELVPYKVTTYETGYYGQYAARRLQASASLFYTKVDNFHAVQVQSVNPNPFLVTLKFQNDGDAIARGAEMELKYHFSRARSAYVNYTYERITDQTANTGFHTRNTPAHKVNFGGLADFGHGISASVNVGYKDNYFISTEGRNVSLAIPAYWRADARLAYALPWHPNAELFVAGQNLFEAHHIEFPDGLSVPRTYQGGMAIKFGGTK